MSSGSEMWQRFVHNLREQYGMNDSPEELRRKSTIGIILGIVMFVIGLGCAGSAWHDYRTLGSSPLELTPEQAVPSPDSITDDARWVSITGPLVFDCSVSLIQKTNGYTIDRRFIASDTGKERYFFVILKHTEACENIPLPITGILKKGVPGLPAWCKEKGLPVPDSNYPLMEFEVGATPNSQRVQVYIGVALIFISAALLGAFIRIRPSA
jgi:hypothetical protein